MKIKLRMVNGPAQEWTVTPRTLRLMETDLGCGLKKSYPILPGGSTVVDWQGVLSIAPIPGQTPNVSRNTWFQPKLSFRW